MPGKLATTIKYLVALATLERFVFGVDTAVVTPEALLIKEAAVAEIDDGLGAFLEWTDYVGGVKGIQQP